MSIKRPSTRSFDITRLSRPSAARYQALIDSLRSIDVELGTGQLHQLRASINAIEAVCQFIGDDSLLREAGVSLALRILQAGLDDTAVGSKPSWLFGGAIDEPEREDGTKKSGRRVGTTFQTLRGLLVNAVSELHKAGMKLPDAAKFVESELRKANVCDKGEQIGAAKILQWRKQSNDSAPRASDESNRIIAEIRAKFLPFAVASSLEFQKQVACTLVKVCARYNSR